MLDSVSAQIAVLDLNGVIIAVNQPWRDFATQNADERIAPLFGYPLGDLETSYDNFIAAVHPDDRQD